CGLFHGCGWPTEQNVEPNISAGFLAAPAEPPPLSPYAARPKGTLSFSADIAPIVFQKCASCHRPGEIGPFPLLTYADVNKRVGQIVTVTQNRSMPPWSAVPGYRVFEHDGSLTIDE